jgi:MFS family permease
MRLPRRARPASAGRVLADIGDTFRFAFGDRRVTVTFLTVLLVSTFSFNLDVLLPLLARRTLDEGAAVFGLIASVFGMGALCGALILATVGRARLLLVLGGAAGFGAFQLVLAPQDTLPVVCMLLFVIGTFYILWGSSALAVLQLAAPEHLRGRAASLYFFGFMGGAPLGGLIAGSLTSIGGTALAFTSAGIIAIVVAAVGALALVRASPQRRVEPRSP